MIEEWSRWNDKRTTSNNEKNKEISWRKDDWDNCFDLFLFAKIARHVNKQYLVVSDTQKAGKECDKVDSKIVQSASSFDDVFKN